MKNNGDGTTKDKRDGSPEDELDRASEAEMAGTLASVADFSLLFGQFKTSKSTN